jgi:hypothetical protein
MPEPEFTPFSERLPSLPAVRVTGPMLWTAVAMIVAGTVTWVLARDYPKDAPLHDDIFAPVLALELPRSAEDIRVVLSPPSTLLPKDSAGEETAESAAYRETARNRARQEERIRALFQRATYADFFLIAAYTSFLMVAWKEIAPRKYRFAMGLMVVAGLSDIAENAGMLRALGTPIEALSDSLAAAASVPSRIKWGTLALILLLFAWALMRVELKPLRRPGTGLLAIMLAIAFVFGATGLSPDIRWIPGIAGWFSYRHLETFARLFALFPVVVIVAGVYDRWQRWRERRLTPHAPHPPG